MYIMSLYCDLYEIGSQCKVFNTGVMCFILRVLVMSRAARFCTLWRRDVSPFGMYVCRTVWGFPKIDSATVDCDTGAVELDDLTFRRTSFPPDEFSTGRDRNYMEGYIVRGSPRSIPARLTVTLARLN